ncbi:MAG: hypothetical protein NVSMB31_11940 [Vulcanimicrobiaceae bacterium]
MIYLIALGLGFVSGLRTFTSIAVLLLSRGGIWGIITAVAAVGEYVVDLMPWVPSRTKMPSIIVRPLSGAFVGYLFSTMHGGSGLIGGVGGVIGALAGTFGGHAARLWAIDRIGAFPAGLAEDLVAIGIAVLLVLFPMATA